MNPCYDSEYVHRALATPQRGTTENVSMFPRAMATRIAAFFDDLPVCRWIVAMKSRIGQDVGTLSTSAQCQGKDVMIIRTMPSKSPLAWICL